MASEGMHPKLYKLTSKCKNIKIFYFLKNVSNIMGKKKKYIYYFIYYLIKIFKNSRKK